MFTGNTCYDLRRLVLFLITPEYPMGRISWLVKDLKSRKGKYDLVRGDGLFEGGASLLEDLLDGWVGGREDSIFPIRPDPKGYLCPGRDRGRVLGTGEVVSPFTSAGSVR